MAEERFHGGAYEARPIRQQILLTNTAAELDMIPAHRGWVDIEWILVYFLGGAAGVTLTFRDKRGTVENYPLPINAGFTDWSREWVHRLTQRQRGEAWTVQCSGAATQLAIYVQGREMRYEGAEEYERQRL